MPDDFVTAACTHCTRGFNLSNPEVRLEPPLAFCPHYGQRAAVDAESMERAKRFRGITA